MTETGTNATPSTELPQAEAPRGESPDAERPPLRRDRSHLVVGGVAAGLAAHTGIDALLWRLGFVALVVAGGAGFWLYLALWLLMPTAPATPDDRTNVLDEWVEKLRRAVIRR
ncbi:PspC domain-containing protein [Modestobacter roseus]|uniref:Phage shock protein C (PspC) family protein n=1 Tax=Modestobacter roseus TaxID=1181884 RepID=A0A562IXT6_9ACTN|nr:PspC domain-containing protein [Modestobacter roseus]MQA35733.1 PspC domain-containing protein [Modestobacter roseus]TWH75663.1 phage shock protein C (PspC) family protein [Modestobacter roseus]